MKARFAVTIKIVTYEERHIIAVSEFNNRLKVKNITFQFPEHPIPKWLPPKPNSDIYQEYFVAVDENRDVRGGYILKHQQFLVNGNVVSIGDYQLPLSEGIIDHKYNMVGLLLITDALNRQPLMYALGMGGPHQPLPKFLDAMRWTLNEVPFYFTIEHPLRFLRNIQVLRTTLWRRLALDAVALSGVGWAVWKLLGLFKKSPGKCSISAEEAERFDNWVEPFWQKQNPANKMVAVRNKQILNILYPKHDKRFIKLKFSKAGIPVGWAVLLDTQMENHKQFLNMRVGTIVDCHSLQGYEREIIRICWDILKSKGVDLVISNQYHPVWRDALITNRFLKGPSNFIFATSPKLTQKLKCTEGGIANVHINRGDGDGPINL